MGPSRLLLLYPIYGHAAKVSLLRMKSITFICSFTGGEFCGVSQQAGHKWRQLWIHVRSEGERGRKERREGVRERGGVKERGPGRKEGREGGSETLTVFSHHTQ